MDIVNTIAAADNSLLLHSKYTRKDVKSSHLAFQRLPSLTRSPVLPTPDMLSTYRIV